jgi:hypothetical protein
MDNMPSYASVYRWMDEHPEFRTRYERARQDSADAMAEQIVQLANDEIGNPHLMRARVDAYKWIAAKLKPRRYGDNSEINIKGEVHGVVQLVAVTPVSNHLNTVEAEKVSTDQTPDATIPEASPKT